MERLSDGNAFAAILEIEEILTEIHGERVAQAVTNKIMDNEEPERSAAINEWLIGLGLPIIYGIAQSDWRTLDKIGEKLGNC
jgi:hypothetical protein